MALGTHMKTTRDEEKTHPMPHGVRRHPVSPWSSPGPRKTVPQDTGHAPQPHRSLKPIVGAPAHDRDVPPIHALQVQAGRGKRQPAARQRVGGRKKTGRVPRRHVVPGPAQHL